MTYDLHKAALASIKSGQRTAEFEAAILELVPPNMRLVVWRALSGRPQYTRGEFVEALAVLWFSNHSNDFRSDGETIAAAAAQYDLSETTVRTAVEKRRVPVNALLRDLKLLLRFIRAANDTRERDLIASPHNQPGDFQR